MKTPYTRRDFIKKFLYGLASIFFLRSLWKDEPDSNTGLKEAQFYASGDDLAG